MVFLFIAYLVTIILFIAPFSIQFSAFFNKDTEKWQTSINFLNKIKYLGQIEKKTTDEKKQSRKKKLPFKISLRSVNRLKNLKMIIVDRVLFEFVAPQDCSYQIYYPLKAFVIAINNWLTYYGYGEKLSVELSAERYIQVILKVKINFFIILSLFFQIIKIELRR